MVVHKKLNKDGAFSRNLLAADFNASCYYPQHVGCTYNAGETVKEVLFTKHASSWKNPTYDNVPMSRGVDVCDAALA